jgi:hypothetical protein
MLAFFYKKNNRRGCHVDYNFRGLNLAFSPVRISGKRNIFMTTAIMVQFDN